MRCAHVASRNPSKTERQGTQGHSTGDGLGFRLRVQGATSQGSMYLYRNDIPRSPSPYAEAL